MTPKRTDVARLLTQAGVTGGWTLHPLTGGGNNRVYRVDAAEETYLLKVYFRHPADPRDRLGAEYAFAQLAWQAGLRSLHEPLACDPTKGMALYEFIEGSKLQPTEIGWSHLNQALQFFQGVNRSRSTRQARRLAEASEACFSIEQHLACVDRRMERLKKIRLTTPLHRQAATVVRATLEPLWKEVRENAVVRARHHKFDPKKELAITERRLSPSDFGFHNAILPTDGKIRFIDFEYAGWDDPAKMVCDFFTQPAVPVPRKFLGRFARAVSSDSPARTQFLARVDLLLSVYRIKWCCIMLNDFLPVGSKRRGFARGPRKTSQRQRSQLAKVRAALTSEI